MRSGVNSEEGQSYGEKRRRDSDVSPRATFPSGSPPSRVAQECRFMSRTAGSRASLSCTAEAYIQNMH